MLEVLLTLRLYYLKLKVKGKRVTNTQLANTFNTKAKDRNCSAINVYKIP